MEVDEVWLIFSCSSYSLNTYKILKMVSGVQDRGSSGETELVLPC